MCWSDGLTGPGRPITVDISISTRTGGATAMEPADWLRRLHHVAWQQNSLRGLNAVLGVIGEAVAGTGAVLWQEEPGGDGRPELSAVAQWSAGAQQSAGRNG